MANYNLTLQDISASFQQLLQKNDDNGYLVNGTGSIVQGLTISGSFNADSMSGDGSGITGIISSSYAVTASHAEIADEIPFSGVTGKPTLVSGSSQIILQDTTGNLSGSRIDGLVLSSSYAISSSHSEFADDSLNSTYAQNTITTGKNLHNTTIAKGTPLYFTGSGTSGNLVGVYPADAGNPDRMPAGGVAGESIAVGAEGIVLLDGYIGGVDTSLFASGDMVYVAVGGGYTNVVPTGSAQIQFLGNVEKSAVNGSGVIQMNGEVRGLPNIQQGYTWVGDSNGVPQAVSTGSFGGGGASFPYVGNAEITGSLLVSSSASSSIIVPNTFGVEGFVVDGNTRIQNGTLNVNQSINAGGIYLQTIGRNSNDPINVDNGLNIRPGAPGIPATNVSISGSLIVSQSISAELQEGYVWVGDSNNRSTTVSTGSFGGGGGSAFPYTGDAQITGSLGVSNTVTSQIFLNPQTLTGTQTVPAGYNGMLTGPVSNAGTIVIESGANLVII